MKRPSIFKRLREEKEYQFTSDWMTGNIYLFQLNLEHLVGTPCHILEIGSFEGRSTIWMLDNIATHPAATIDCIDKKFRTEFRANIKKTGKRDKIFMREGRSFDVLRGMKKSDFDFIYIDGSHATISVLEDAVLSFRLAKVGAIIAFDDYLLEDPAFSKGGFAKPAIDAFLSIYKTQIEVLEHSHQVWVRKIYNDLPD